MLAKFDHSTTGDEDRRRKTNDGDGWWISEKGTGGRMVGWSLCFPCNVPNPRHHSGHVTVAAGDHQREPGKYIYISDQLHLAVMPPSQATQCGAPHDCTARTRGRARAAGLAMSIEEEVQAAGGGLARPRGHGPGSGWFASRFRAIDRVGSEWRRDTAGW